MNVEKKTKNLLMITLSKEFIIDIDIWKISQIHILDFIIEFTRKSYMVVCDYRPFSFVWMHDDPIVMTMNSEDKAL